MFSKRAKFRIVSNGYQYRAQTREWFFFWVDCWYHGSLSKPVKYNTRQEAEAAIEKYAADCDEKGAKWQTVWSC